MARILFAWELGGGMGHVAKHLPLAAELRQRGHEVAFAMRNLRFAETLLGRAGIPWFQAPVMLDKLANEIAQPHTFAQILYNVGYGSAEFITVLARGWQNLYQLYRPDLLVCDHSPTALLAARGLAMRKVVTGTGFCVPFDAPVPPVLRRDPPPVPEVLARDEARITGNINHALARLGGAPVERVAQLYQADAELLMTFRELDHVRERQQQEGIAYWGIGRPESGATPQWPQVPGLRIFAYLKNFKTLPDLLQLLQRAGSPVLIHAPDAGAALKQRFAGPSLSFSDAPLHMAQVAAGADVAITNAGHGTTAEFLLGGVPQLLLPLHLEQLLTGENVQRLGAGLCAPALQTEAVAQKLRALLEEPGYRAAAREVAARYAGFDATVMEQRLAGRILELL